MADENDLTSVDGRARLAETARPLLQRVPEGVYRELLVDRLAREVRMSAPRLAALLGLGPGPATPVIQTHRPRPMTGRGSLLSQALAHLLQYPSAAASVRDPESLRLGGERGLEVLAEIIEMLHESPNLSTGQLVERWRDRPEHGRLLELASQPLPDLPVEAAQREFIAAVDRLTREAGPERRIDELIQKAGTETLSDEEKQELRELQARPRQPSRPAR